MYATLYTLSGLLFVASVAAYAFFAVKLSQDIKAGLVPVKSEPEKK